MQYIIKTVIAIMNNKAINAPTVIAAISASDKLFHAEKIGRICFIMKDTNSSFLHSYIIMFLRK